MTEDDINVHLDEVNKVAGEFIKGRNTRRSGTSADYK